MTKTWRDKAHREIASMCRVEWRRANIGPNGQRYKRHWPYTVPELAQKLVECLAKDDEAAAKAIFVWEGAALKAAKKS